MTTRRDFLIQSIQALGLGAVGGFFSGCSSLDKSIIDSNHTKRTVAIIGAGIGGLSLSYYLKNQKQQFVMFEASQRVGGRMYRADNSEWGAFEFYNKDEQLKKILKTLNMNTSPLDSETWTFENGSTEFLNALKEKSFGLLQHRQLKLQHRLVRIRRLSQFFRLTFQTPRDEETYDFSHVVICLPGNQVLSIDGIGDFETGLTALRSLRTGQKVHAVRLIKPPLLQQTLISNRNVLTTEFSDDRFIKVRFGKNKTYFTILSTDRRPLRELNEIQKIIAKNFSSTFSRNDLLSTTDTVLDWSTKEYINLGYYRIDYKSDLVTNLYDRTSSLHLISDSFNSSEGRVENVLKQTQKTAGILSLYS